MRFLLVEDTLDVAEAIAGRLGNAGHVIDLAQTLEDAWHFAVTNDYDLVILDMNLPDGSGLDFLKRLRQERIVFPVLVLTARLSVNDKIGALDYGADDYMVKPFDFGELEARIRAIVRRGSTQSDRSISVGNLVFDMAERSLTIDGSEVELTRRETILLEIFLTNRGRVLEKEELLKRLFGLESNSNANAVELYVARLRRKLEGSDLEIRTLRGIGYQARDTVQGKAV